jgi:hypothetical protein
LGIAAVFQPDDYKDVDEFILAQPGVAKNLLEEITTGKIIF